MSHSDDPANGPSTDWRAARRAERRARRAARRAGPDNLGGIGNGPAVGGTILVVIGAVLLARQFGYQLPERWWAALLLIPAVGALVAAIRSLRADEGFSRRTIGSLVAAAFFLVLAGGVFFGLDWDFLWPTLLIAAGLGMVTRNYWGR